MKFLICILFCNLTWASAPALQVSHVEGWKYVALEKDSFAAKFAAGAAGILTYGQSQRDGPEITVALHQLDLPKTANLGAEASAWHKFMFTGQQNGKVNVVSERTFLFKGRWRYYIEYESDTGTMLNTAMLVTVGEGQVRALIYENHRADFKENIANVRNLFRGIEFSLKAPAPKN